MAQNGEYSYRSAGGSNISSNGPIAAIILAGKTGSGKSSIIKLLGGKDNQGQDPVADGGLDSCTLKPAAYMTTVNNRRILLLDTPGFDDSAVDNITVLNEIVSNLYMFAMQPHEIHTHGVIFLHDICETRFGGSQKKTLEILRALCGDRAMRNVIIGTTMWSDEGSQKFRNEVRREGEFTRKWWKGIFKTVRVPYENKDVAVGMVNDLLARTPMLLQVQEEMLKPPHTCENTTAGKIAIPEGKAEAERLKRELEEEQKRAAEEARKQEERHKKQQEEAKAFYEAEHAKLKEEARKREEDFTKREKQEEERRKQHMQEIKTMNAENQRMAQEAEDRRIADSKRIEEEFKRTREDGLRREQELSQRMAKMEADRQEQLRQDRKRFEDETNRRIEEQRQTNERLAEELRRARTKPKGFWRTVGSWFGF